MMSYFCSDDDMASCSHFAIGVAVIVVLITITTLILVATGVWQVLWALVRLLDLLFTVKFTAKRIQKQSSTSDNNGWTMGDTFEECVVRYNKAEFCVLTDAGKQQQQQQRITFGEAQQASSAVAQYVTTKLSTNTKQDNDNDNDKMIVAIFMHNSCEFVVTLFGLIRIGIPAALVNTSLRGASLVHALTAALGGDNCCTAVLVSPELAPVLQAIQDELSGIQIITCGTNCTLDPWSSSMVQDVELSTTTWKTFRQGVSWDDTCVYIYTSGTTGLPKASKMNHLRLWTAGCVTRKVCNLRPTDRLYCPLPLYHASGCTLGLVATLQTGSTLVLRSKFSASNFSRDLVQHECNSVQYIGEMARYLVAAKPVPEYDGIQPLRFAYGNGMPTEVWVPFQQRYNVHQVNEFYASTEGNVNIFNNTGRGIGACGIVPRGFEWLYPIGLFQHDLETGELVRNARTGLCVPVAHRGQPGELLGLIHQDDPSRRFDGYTNDLATRRKIVRNVKKPGDAYFRSGDLLKQDAWGFLYFCDRVGDTFRWKGENVSTSQVARTLLECSTDGHSGKSKNFDKQSPAVFAEAIVYGVEVPGNPGRAGMAAAVLADSSSSSTSWRDDLWRALQKELPRYAQPLFLRVTDEIETTSTQKYKKTKLVQESFVDCGNDVVYLRGDGEQSFVVLTPEVKQAILSGARRV